MARKDLEKKRYAAIGFMSGTSMDGIDLALLVTNGKSKLERGPAASYPYEAAFRARLAAALETARSIENASDRPGDLASLDREIALRHVAALRRFLEENNLRLSDIDLVGFHGQTVLHRPERGLSVQLGDAQYLADETGLPVVHNLRANDMAHGGQGAPLAPVFHRALAANLGEPWAGSWPVLFVNIGGISNITWISEQGGLIACDAGPGNALIDQWVAANAGVPFDQDGAIASEGSVVASLADRYLSSPWFGRPYPKSLDRNDFAPLEAGAASLEDGARTLAHVTAAAICKAIEQLPERPRLAVVCGGGRKNAAIMDDLKALLNPAIGAHGEDKAGEPLPLAVISAEDAGLDGDTIEAEAWAYLAVRCVRGLKITWPHTTGVAEAITGGEIAYPSSDKP